MRIRHIRDVLRLMFKVNETADQFEGRHICPFFWSAAGMGKSSSIKRFTQEEQIGFIDKRLSQSSPEDVGGWPVADRERGVMAFLPPADMPIGERHGKRGITHLDEFIRARREVLETCFQVVLDHRIGEHPLDPGWITACSGNPQGDQEYQQQGMHDLAMIDRFAHLRIQADSSYVADWQEYIHQKPGLDRGIVDKIISLVAFDPEKLMQIKEVELGFKVRPSGRSWENVARVATAALATDCPEGVAFEVIQGMIGDEVAAFWKDFSLDVTPDDIINGRKVKADWERSLRGSDSKSRQNLIALLSAIGVREPTWARKPEEVARLIGFFEWTAHSQERDLLAVLMRQRPDWGNWFSRTPELKRLAVAIMLGENLPS